MAEVEDMAVCPYNKNHRFKKRDFTYHLSRCKERVSKRDQFETCKFNSMHIIEKDRIFGHEEVCPDKPIKQKIEYDDYIPYHFKKSHSHHGGKSASRKRDKRSRSKSRDKKKKDKHRKRDKDEPYKRRERQFKMNQKALREKVENLKNCIPCLTSLKMCEKCKEDSKIKKYLKLLSKIDPKIKNHLDNFKKGQRMRKNSSESGSGKLDEIGEKWSDSGDSDKSQKGLGLMDYMSD